MQGLCAVAMAFPDPLCVRCYAEQGLEGLIRQDRRPLSSPNTQVREQLILCLPKWASVWHYRHLPNGCLQSGLYRGLLALWKTCQTEAPNISVTGHSVSSLVWWSSSQFSRSVLHSNVATPCAQPMSLSRATYTKLFFYQILYNSLAINRIAIQYW